MPKITKKKIAKVAEAPEAISTPEPAVEAQVYGAPKVITYENVQVVRILEDRGAFKRCEMSNGTTMDVPASLFD